MGEGKDPEREEVVVGGGERERERGEPTRSLCRRRRGRAPPRRPALNIIISFFMISIYITFLQRQSTAAKASAAPLNVIIENYEML